MNVGKLYLFAAMAAVALAPAASATNFALLLDSDGDGTSQTELQQIDSITIEDLTIDEREGAGRAEVPRYVWRGAKRAGFRVSGPGDAHYGSITIQARADSVGAKQLNQWWEEVVRSQGKNIRKNMSVIALERDGSSPMTYEFVDSFPTSWDPGEYSPSSNIDVSAQLTVEYEGVNFLASESDGPECNISRTGGIHVTGRDAGSGADTDTMWESCSGGRWSGGEPGLILQYPFRETEFHETTPGHKRVSSVTLRGPLTSTRDALHDWITAAANGKPWKRTVTVKEILKDGADGKTFVYTDCFPTRYVFPAFSATGEGDLQVRIAIRPNRIEFQS